MLTIPINGWVAKLGPAGQRLCSFSIAKYGAQTGNDWEWFPDAGNGILCARIGYAVQPGGGCGHFHPATSRPPVERP